MVRNGKEIYRKRHTLFFIFSVVFFDPAPPFLSAFIGRLYSICYSERRKTIVVILFAEVLVRKQTTE
jgi:hypothetical protein